MPSGRLVDEVVAEAVGQHQRADPMLPGTGGPAGNARLTAWTGLLLIVLFAAELVTLLDVTGLIDWHVAIGVVLIPPALLKTASTGWRILRYYLGGPPYRRAGPPPFLLRVLGPLVVAFTLALLGSGLVLLALGPQAARQGLVIAGHPVSAVSVHAGLAVCWAVVTGLHVLGRLTPPLVIVAGPRLARWSVVPERVPVPAVRARAVALVFTVIASVVAVTLVVPVNPGWSVRRDHGARPFLQRPLT